MNSVEMQPMTNSVSVSLFDVYTTSYFLSESKRSRILVISVFKY